MEAAQIISTEKLLSSCSEKIILSIIIVTYNSDYFIKQCLSSIYEYNDIGDNNIEIIVVDNSPCVTEYFMEAIKSFRNIIFIKNKDNVGYGKANNIGANIANGKILLFLNPDIRFVEPVFSEVLRLFNEYYNIGIIGCKLIDENGDENNTYGFFPEEMSIIKLLRIRFFYRPLRRVPSSNIFPWGADIFIRKNDFVAAGKFDEEFFLCHEEPDLCRRIYPKSVFIINKRIVHYEGQSKKQISNNFDVWLQSLVLYHHKYGLDLKKTLRRYKLIYILSYIRDVLLCRNAKDIKEIIIKFKALSLK